MIKDAVVFRDRDHRYVAAVLTQDFTGKVCGTGAVVIDFRDGMQPLFDIGFFFGRDFSREKIWVKDRTGYDGNRNKGQ